MTASARFRSRAIGVFLIAGLLPLGALRGVSAPAPVLILGPMLGHVSETEANVWIRGSGPARWGVQISESPDLAHSRRILGRDLAEGEGFNSSVSIPGLHAGQRYHYTVLLNGKPAILPPYPSFTTAPAPGGPQHLRFAFISCSGYAPHDPAAGWADLSLRTNYDLILQLGDNHYANSTQLQKQRDGYLGQRLCSSFREATSRVPVYGIWDDHDFAENDSDSTVPGREEIFRAFKEHWANPAYGEPGNPRVNLKYTRGCGVLHAR